jgi:hypothetical protein
MPELTAETDRLYTTKQMGDACEMLVAAELTLNGIPSVMVPDSWPGYDVIAHPPGKPLQRVSVKSRTRGSSSYVSFDPESCDWLAIVLLDASKQRQLFIVPKDKADEHAFDRSFAKASGRRGLYLNKIVSAFAVYRDNFKMESHPRQRPNAL